MQVTLDNVSAGDTVKVVDGNGQRLNAGDEVTVLAVVRDADTGRTGGASGLIVSGGGPYIYSETRFEKEGLTIYNTEPGTRLLCSNNSGQPRLDYDQEYEVVAVVERAATARGTGKDGFIVKETGQNVAIPYIYSPSRFERA